jgi:hypothetical protein
VVSVQTTQLHLPFTSPPLSANGSFLLLTRSISIRMAGLHGATEFGECFSIFSPVRL